MEKKKRGGAQIGSEIRIFCDFLWVASLIFLVERPLGLACLSLVMSFSVFIYGQSLDFQEVMHWNEVVDLQIFFSKDNQKAIW